LVLPVGASPDVLQPLSFGSFSSQFLGALRTAFLDDPIGYVRAGDRSDQQPEVFNEQGGDDQYREELGRPHGVVRDFRGCVPTVNRAAPAGRAAPVRWEAWESVQQSGMGGHAGRQADGYIGLRFQKRVD
jgi:hypothetical protein